MSARRIAVLGGGRSSEHDVSLASAASVADGLRQAGHEVREITIGRDGTWSERTPRAADAGPRADGRGGGATPGGGAAPALPAEIALTVGGTLLGIEVVFPALHGPFGEDGTIQGLLESLGLPYVGAGVLASALCLDKIAFKQLMKQSGIPQVDYRGVTVERFEREPAAVAAAVAELGWPVFVKPARLGSSLGIARVSEQGALRTALTVAFEHDPLVIVEAGAAGLEVECSVLGNEDPIASEPGEIRLGAGAAGWYDFDAKYAPGGMELVVPARISAAARERVRTIALAAFRCAGCVGLARADFFVQGDEALLNELNTMPGFTPTSVYGALFTASGIPYPQLLDRLIELALARHARERAHSF